MFSCRVRPLGPGVKRSGGVLTEVVLASRVSALLSSDRQAARELLDFTRDLTEGFLMLVAP